MQTTKYATGLWLFALCVYFTTKFIVILIKNSSNLFGTLSKRLVNRVTSFISGKKLSQVSTLSQIPVVILSGTVTWSSNDFFLAKFANLVRMIEKNPEQITLQTKQQFYQNRVQNLSKSFQQIYSLVSVWFVKMKSLNEVKVQSALANESTILNVRDIENRLVINLTIS
jgi:hypothetical protein